MLALTAAACASPGATLGAQRAPADTAVRVTFGAFVDVYYAWDVGRPPTLDRSFAGGTPFTTQPARHNEFNVNLAFVEARLDGPSLRGRAALQTGTSVQSNYAGEPTTGQVSGPGLARTIQEATVGMKLADALWVDAGVLFSHLGMEGWISRDNPTYTRSLVAEYSPYYQSGVRLAWAASPRLATQVVVVNGWQNLSENNGGKSAGARLDFALAPATTVSYYNLLGPESGNRLRTFNGAGIRTTRGAVTILGEADLGTQARSRGDGGTARWYGATAIVRLQVAPRVAIAGRVERYDDPDQVIVSTGSIGVAQPNGAFRGTGASIGIDVAPQPRAVWRTELRRFRNRSAVFPDGAGGAPRTTGGFVVTSLAMTF